MTNKIKAYVLPYNKPIPCGWCNKIIKNNKNARNVLLDEPIKPEHYGYYGIAYDCYYQIICVNCYDEACKNNNLREKQAALIRKWMDKKLERGGVK